MRKNPRDFDVYSTGGGTGCHSRVDVSLCFVIIRPCGHVGETTHKPSIPSFALKRQSSKIFDLKSFYNQLLLDQPFTTMVFINYFWGFNVHRKKEFDLKLRIF
jgi:hypothetical protein